MNHLDLDLKAEVLTERGELQLLIATWDLDRENEKFARGSFQQSIAAWKKSHKANGAHPSALVRP